MRSRRRRGAASALAVLAAAALGTTALGRNAAGPRARAAAFSVDDDQRAAVSLARAGARSQRAASHEPELSVSGRARVGVGSSSATASAHAGGVSAFDGLVTARSVDVATRARDGRAITTGAVRGLQVAGQAVGTITSPATVSTGAYVVKVLRDGTALRVTLRRDYHDIPAGSTVAVGLTSATAPAAPAPVRTATAPPPSRSHPQGGSPKPRHAAKPSPTKHHAKRHRPRRHPRPVLTGGGYTFPVLSPDARTADNFGAPREIGAHQGDDIFAPFGAPVVAVHDGVVRKVGTLPISGNRLWLWTPKGDGFFYCHLSAFSPAAVNGAHVKAGTILGYVGNTGDAEPTPPHLHFEIHPHGKAAIDPFPTLTAWQQHRDRPAGAWADTGQRPGTLVEVRDFLARG